MSWKEVFKDLSDMEGIVQEMEENEDIQEISEEEPNIQRNEKSKAENELKVKLMSEILQFDQKSQLKNVNQERKEQSEQRKNESDEDLTLVESDESKGLNNERKNSGLKLANIDCQLETDNRRGSGILR